MNRAEEQVRLLECGVAAPAQDPTCYTSSAPGITAGNADRRRRAAVLAAALLGVAAFAGARAYSSGLASPVNNIAWSAFGATTAAGAVDSAGASSEQPAPDASAIVIDDEDDACVVTTSPANDVSPRLTLTRSSLHFACVANFLQREPGLLYFIFKIASGLK
jgi:hypothetical protein